MELLWAVICPGLYLTEFVALVAVGVVISIQYVLVSVVGS